MSPDLVRSAVGRIHENFSDDVEELVKAAEEIRTMTSDDFNPLLIDILAPIFIDMEYGEEYNPVVSISASKAMSV